MIPKCVLFIGDNSNFASLVKLILQQHQGNWQILTVSDAKQGLICAEVEQPNVIILDISRSDGNELNGLEIHRLLKSNSFTRMIPVICVIPLETDSEISEFQITEDITTVTRPFVNSELVTKLSKVSGDREQ